MHVRSSNSHFGLNHSKFLLPLLSAACLAFFAALASCSGTSTADGPTDNLRVGVLLDADNRIYPIGKTAVTAIELAAEDFNRYLKENGHTKQIELFVEDTQGDPQVAAEKIQRFAWAGIIPVFTGTSAEILAVSDYAEQNDHLLLSGYSTAPSLAKKDNRLFRFCLNDSKQAKGLVRLAMESNLKSLVLVYRDDVYGNDLKTYVKEIGEQYGLDIDDGVTYSPDETDFTAVAGSIEQKVIQKKSEYPPDRVAVLLIALNEVTGIFGAADGNAELESVRWIGAVGVEPDATVFAETGTLGFAERVSFTVCDFGIEMDAIKKPFRHVPARLQEKSGMAQIPATAYMYYDAMWVLAESWLSIAKMDADLLKKNIFFKADTTLVCTVDIGMDESGDREWGQYQFYTIQDGTFQAVALILFYDWAVDGEFVWL